MSGSGWRRALSAWADSGEALARDLRTTHSHRDATAIAEAPDREQVILRGEIRSLTLRPRGGVAALEAELDDGSGVITLVWLGRRRIIGIEPGRALAVRGCIGIQGGVRVMFNPRYELVP